MPRFVHYFRSLLILAALAAGASRAVAIESVRVPLDAPAIDLTKAIESYHSGEDRLLVSTAPGSDGIVRRIEVRAREEGTRPSWIVFALTNDTGEQIERLIVAPHFRLVGSGVVWPDLGASRISAITASHGFPPEREENAEADLFRLTLDPGATVTYVAELRAPHLPQLTLWAPDAYKDKVTSFALYNGMIIGVAGLLALFLTIVFVVKGAVIFPAAAALAWTVLAYVSIDFGFWTRIFGAAGASLPLWRAGAEAVLAATLLVFLFAYLNLNRWYVRASHVAVLWLAFLAALAGLAAYDPPVAAGIARISLATIAAVGFILIVYLSTHGYDRAIMLIPTWFLLLAWVVAGAFAVTGYLSNDLVSPALIGGLVLIVMLIGFTILQNAFAGGALGAGVLTDVERKALALGASGDIVFDWDVASDRLFVGPALEPQLGLDAGALEGSAAAFLAVLHPAERDRFRACLDALLEQHGGQIAEDFRLRSSAGHYFWFRLKARPVVGADGEVLRIVGLLSDVTEAKITEERLLHDAVHDTLTGMPNREIFFDRLDQALALAQIDRAIRPTLVAIDVDGLRAINEAAGLPAGDSVLATIARRIARLLKPLDTLARLSADQFVVLVVSEAAADEVIGFANLVRRAVTTPVTFGEHEFPLAATMGIVLFDPNLHKSREDLLKDAEIAMRRGKRAGGNRIEVFSAAMRKERSDRADLSADIGAALARGEMKILFQPIVQLGDRTVAGFEALLRWDHPRFGRLGLGEFLEIAEETETLGDLGLYMLDRAACELAAWQGALDVDPPIFACVNLPSDQWLRQDLVPEIRNVLSRYEISRGSLVVEVSESQFMQNPEHAVQVLTRLKAQGTGLCLDGFGTGAFPLAIFERLPFDLVKIDRSLTRPTAQGRQSALSAWIIALAHDLGMDVVAKGVDSEKDTAELGRLGCDYGQGHAFGRPLGVIDARKLVGAATIAA